MRRMRTHAHENREPATTRWVRAVGLELPASAKRTLRRMKTAVLLPLSVSASVSGSQSRSLSVFVARHDLSGSITIADCGCDADTDSDPDGLLS